MKLYEVTYLDDCDFGHFLTTGDSAEEVKARAKTRLEIQSSCLMYFEVKEIKEVDGYPVKLEYC